MTKTAENLLSNAESRKYMDRYINIENDIGLLSEDKKELKKEMKAEGIDMKAFALAVKAIIKPVDPKTKAKANTYIEEFGQFKLFAI